MSVNPDMREGLNGAWLLAGVDPGHFGHLQVLAHMCIHTMGDSELT